MAEIVNNDLCGKCGLPGDILLCDECPNAMHLTCLSFTPPNDDDD
jgi:hypothetical protein